MYHTFIYIDFSPVDDDETISATSVESLSWRNPHLKIFPAWQQSYIRTKITIITTCWSFFSHHAETDPAGTRPLLQRLAAGDVSQSVSGWRDFSLTTFRHSRWLWRHTRKGKKSAVSWSSRFSLLMAAHNSKSFVSTWLKCEGLQEFIYIYTPPFTVSNFWNRRAITGKERTAFKSRHITERAPRMMGETLNVRWTTYHHYGAPEPVKGRENSNYFPESGAFSRELMSKQTGAKRRKGE